MRTKKRVTLVRYEKNVSSPTEDVVAVEEPLEIFLNGKPHHVTMRLPGEEIHLALGYCFAEKIIDSIRDILTVLYCHEETGNRVDVMIDSKCLATGRSRAMKRRSTAYSSCGICGKEMIDDIRSDLQERAATFRISVADIEAMNSIVETKQNLFRETGGTHAAAIFRKDGRLLSFSEDVGRHNALDKAIGQLVFEDKLAHAAVVVLTSRLSYEMVQKTGRLGAEILIGASSPTSLAIELAKSINLTLIGFSRKECGNVYAVEERILSKENTP